MSQELPDKTTRRLVDQAAQSRARVASDVAELAKELTLPELKDRAIDAAERSVETIAIRALGRLLEAPRRLWLGARQRPYIGLAVAVGVSAIVWQIAARRKD